ncbi:hypothetical protein PCI56_06535 [Plesiomonas shigelloides subsp. oncorhynchi]|nr:hypothetical protein [Plesiomonas shigelloides]
MFIFSLLIFFGSLGWLIFEPGWEPSLFALSSLSAVVVSDNHVKSYIKKKYQDYAAKKIVISEGKVVTEDNELMKIIRPLCLGNDIDITVINMQDDVLEKHARKKVDDENQKYYLLAQVDRRKKK